MDLGISGKTAIVGGSSKGIGRETALNLAREGANVVICARNADILEQTAIELGELTSPSQILPIVADLSKFDDIKRLVATTENHWGTIDILVNNVGGPPPGLAKEMTDKDWHDGMELSFYSAIRLSHLALPGMRKLGWGRIINILSMAIKEPEDNLAISTVARTAVAAYAKILSLELASEGITVNNVLPGSIETERLELVARMQANFHNRNPDNGMEERLSHIAAGRFGKPEEMADLISFLASERAGFITGTSILIDGGQIRAIT